MRKSFIAALAASPALLGGCSTFPNYTGADAACISGAAANPFKGLADAHVAIFAVDGQPGWGGGTYCVSPGQRQVTYRALEAFAHSSTQGAEGTVALEMEAGHRYSLRARIERSAATLQLVDVTDPQPRVTQQFEARTGDSGIRPAVVLVPVR